MAEQGTLQWHRERLGIITSSKIGDLIATIKRDKEGKIVLPSSFSKTAMTYIHKKASERGLLEEMVNDDLMFERYIEEEEVSSKAIRLGQEKEPLARFVYSKRTGLEVQEVGMQKYGNLFGDSPDGVVLFERTIGTLEIKCPMGGTHNMYSMMEKPQDLLEAKQDYYIQCQGHILANNAEWCDFVSFDPRQKYDMHILRILPDEEIIELIKHVVTQANDLIEQLTKK